MQIILLRVGIDTGSGGIHGPLFSDGSFEYIPNSGLLDERGPPTSALARVRRGKLTLHLGRFRWSIDRNLRPGTRRDRAG
jgi:hypothetical protein